MSRECDIRLPFGLKEGENAFSLMWKQRHLFWETIGCKKTNFAPKRAGVITSIGMRSSVRKQEGIWCQIHFQSLRRLTLNQQQHCKHCYSLWRLLITSSVHLCPFLFSWKSHQSLTSGILHLQELQWKRNETRDPSIGYDIRVTALFSPFSFSGEPREEEKMMKESCVTGNVLIIRFRSQSITGKTIFYALSSKDIFDMNRSENYS